MKPTEVKIVDHHTYAQRLAHWPSPQCPAEDCKGHLVVLLRHNEVVPPWHIGCNGIPMHVWKKEDLFYLRRVQPVLIVEDPLASKDA